MNNIPVHGVNIDQLSEAVGLSTVRLYEMMGDMFKSTRLDPCVAVTRIGNSIVFFFSAASEHFGYNNFNEGLLKKIRFAESHFICGAEAIFLASRNEIYEYGEETDKLVDLETLKGHLERGEGILTAHDLIPLTMDLINDDIRTMP